MLKRTKGRILLTLLVVTGFAGTLKNNTLTSQERKFVITNFKDTRTELLKTIKGLSPEQLNYKKTADQLSIKECFYRLVSTEEYLWKKFDASMALPVAPERRAEVILSDEAIQRYACENPENNNAFIISPLSNTWESMDKAASAFKFSRTKRLKYLRTTTSDIRNHFTHLPFGWLDNYQLIIFIQSNTDRYFQKINAMMNQPGFPAN
ncbi:DinB family protein [Terrimonas pollutisoli]|uniref:DinB family protein n=1 Tax=Terrimonas pollutisoli TaxID=3034147 RepID=UPI0023EDFEF4|nr:DinB family protein [Terrimonas sp. H1YJ31]